MEDPANQPKDFNPLWRAIFSGEHPELRRGRKILRLLSPTASDRCRLCYAGFDGFSAPILPRHWPRAMAAQSAFLREV